MPTYPPRETAVKKNEELLKRLQELKYAIAKGYPQEKLNKAVEKFRGAKLSLFKAQIHIVREKKFQNKPCNLKSEKIESEILEWESLSPIEIIQVATKNIVKK